MLCCFPCLKDPEQPVNSTSKTQTSNFKGQPSAPAGIKSLQIDKTAISTTRTATGSPMPGDQVKSQLDPELYRQFTKSVTSDTSYSRHSNMTIHEYVTKAKLQNMNSVDSETETLEGVVQQSKSPSNLVRIKTMDAVVRRAASASLSDEFLGDLAHMVIMGCCNSGKSTLVKQMRLKYLGRVTRNLASSTLEREELAVNRKLMLDQTTALLKQISHKAVFSLQRKISDVLMCLPVVEENIGFVDTLKEDEMFKDALKVIGRSSTAESSQ